MATAMATGDLPEGLAERYAAIAAAKPAQQANYVAWLESGAVTAAELQTACRKLGLSLDLSQGTVSYASGPEGARFGAEGSLCYDLMYVRHGKTTGNTEPRVYQVTPSYAPPTTTITTTSA